MRNPIALFVTAVLIIISSAAIAQFTLRSNPEACSQWNSYIVITYSTCDANYIPELTNSTSSVSTTASDGVSIGNDNDEDSGNDLTGSGHTITYSITTNPGNRYSINSSTGDTTVPTVSSLVVGTDVITKQACSVYGCISYTDTVTVSSGGGGDVAASIDIITRQNGASPEIVYFTAQDSTCSDCTDVFGLSSSEGDAWGGALSYSFDFDDSDSGTYNESGRSRDTFQNSLPLAAHTFYCFGSGDANWDATDSRCEYDVSVRVQAPDGDFDTANIQVNVQPLTGTGGKYADADIYCISGTSDYSWCPHSTAARHLTDFPAPNAYGDDQLYIVDNDGTNYDDFCPNATYEEVVAIAYGPHYDDGVSVGSQPEIDNVTLGARTNTATCVASFDATTISTLSTTNYPERDGNGDISDGWGFGQKVIGFRTGKIEPGQATNFTQYIGLDGDNFSTAIGDGSFDMGQSSSYCNPQNGGAPTDCDDYPYISMQLVADSVFKGNCSGEPIHIFTSFGAGWVDSVILDTEFGGCVQQHVARINGGYRSMIAESFMTGNSSTDDSTAGSGITNRPITSGAGAGSGGSHDLTKDPTDYSGTDFMRTGVSSTDFTNRYLSFANNEFYDPVQDASATNGFPLGFYGLYSGAYNNVFNTITSGDDGLQELSICGRYVTNRATTHGGNGSANMSVCDWYSDGTSYHDTDDIYSEGTPSGSGSTQTGAAALSFPSADWR